MSDLAAGIMRKSSKTVMSLQSTRGNLGIITPANEDGEGIIISAYVCPSVCKQDIDFVTSLLLSP